MLIEDSHRKSGVARTERADWNEEDPVYRTTVDFDQDSIGRIEVLKYDGCAGVAALPPSAERAIMEGRCTPSAMTIGY